MYTITKLIFYCLLFCASISSAIAQTRTNVPYLDAKGNPQIAASVTVLSGAETELTSGWYLASSSLNYTQTLTMTGDVRLILENGCNMAVRGNEALNGSQYDDGIKIIDTNSLTIYAQTVDTLTMGKLTSEGGGVTQGGRGAGIGGVMPAHAGGYITINGGYISAYGFGVGSGIGGHTITINGGKIYASGGGSSGAAGPGIGSKDTGDVAINGGDITAVGGGSGSGGAAGIGGCMMGYSGNITISGGIINASSTYGSGIGCGGFGGGGSLSTSGDPNGIITITGGIISASGVTGIGGSDALMCKNIIISGGNITAKGSNGAGIGGGNGSFSAPGGGPSGNILIYGEYTRVTATGGANTYATSQGWTLQQDIGAGSGATPGVIQNVFVALPKGNLLRTDSLEIGNPVTFTADPQSLGTLAAILPAPFDTIHPINLITNLGTGGNAKTLSVISSMATQKFAYPGYRNSPITQSDSILMGSGATVNFNLLPMLNNVPYLDEHGERKMATSVTSLTGISDITGGDLWLTDGWYLVSNSLNYSGVLTILGDVHLILEDGCNMTVQGNECNMIYITKSIYMQGPIITSSLTIYAQSLDTLTMGKLKVFNNASINQPGGAGIGHSFWEGIEGNLTINGGNITAVGGAGGTGINSGNITINGGYVSASGSSTSAGIDGDNVTISGGTVKTFGAQGAGIRAGGYPANGPCGTVTITGGDISTTGLIGIGAWNSDSLRLAGNIIISGGNIVAKGIGGAGIGAGGIQGRESENILIYGENTKVTASGTTNIAYGNNIFVALPKGNLLGTDSLGNSLEIGNPVTFTANPASTDTVTVTLPAPFDTKSPIPLLKGLGTGTNAKIMSVISSMPTQSFALRGYRNSPISKINSNLMQTGVSVNFTMYRSYIMVNGR